MVKAILLVLAILFVTVAPVFAESDGGGLIDNDPIVYSESNGGE